MYWILFIGVALLSYVVQASFQKNFQKASQLPLLNGMAGREVAVRMLSDHGIHDVKVTSTPGQLTDNFNPTNKTVNLSQAVYAQTNVAAAAVAAHECGHAVQHATGYFPVKLRSALVPVVSVSSRLVPIVLLVGMLLINIFPQIMWIGIGLFALTTLFSIVTLPVEIDASRRALAWLNQADIIDPSNADEARGALRSAAYTYVVGALSSLATLIYYLSIFTGRK
ncbi:MAG: zinc metallopeptidase [Bacteroidales bacterium]|jgi:Zn-dependent membrane protease YugP|nr:zinc metallopeptidase [Bacteroidales bacterium]MBR3450737.1 zinc metallopeptidase [Bacteroidales bacterium]